MTDQRMNYKIYKKYMDKKECTKCKTIRDLFDFGNDKTRPDGKFPQCKFCTFAAKGSDYYQFKSKLNSESSHPNLKKCSKCLEWLEPICFAKCSNGKLGVNSVCKKCRNAKHIFRNIQRAKLAEEITNDSRECKRCNKIKCLSQDFHLIKKRNYYNPICKECKEKSHQKYRRQNKSLYVKASRKYQKANPEVGRYHTKLRKARKRGAEGLYTLQDWLNLKNKYNFSCLKCGQQEPNIKLTVDHIIPLSRGGTNYITNIQPLCNICNSSKGTKTIDFRPI